MAEGGELVPAISITDSGSTPTVNSPADLATPPSRARSHSSPRKETESIGTSSTTTRLRENLEGPDAKRSDSPFRSTVQDRLLNLYVFVSYLLSNAPAYTMLSLAAVHHFF